MALALSLLLGQEVEDLVRLLRSEKIEERSEAERRLRERGTPALPALEKALKDADPELARRAQRLVRELRDPFFGESAEKTMLQVEERLARATSIQVNLKFGFARGDAPAIVDPAKTFRIALQGKRALLALGDERTVSDGERVRGKGGSSYAPEDLVADLKTGLRTVGVMVTLYAAAVSRDRAEGVQRGTVDVLPLTTATLAGRDVLEMKLWIDPKSRLPRKRISTTPGEGENRQSFRPPPK